LEGQSFEQEKSKKVKEGKKAKVRFCKDCRFYDKSTERDFRRKVGKKDEHGKNVEIVEVRAVCRNTKASSFGHLVMAEYSKRQCSVWEKGLYKVQKNSESREPKKNNGQEKPNQ
jgi:hypothetical protein